MTLIPTSLQRVSNYDLAGKDPAVYDGMDPSTPREWKDVPLPTRGAAEAEPAGPSPKQPLADPETIKGCWRCTMHTQMSLSHLEWMPVKTMRKPG